MTQTAVIEKVSIYMLIDPRTGLCRYVGKTADPEARLRAHLQPAQLQAHTRKNSWLKNLLAAGLEPCMEIIDQVDPELADDAERFWIHFHRRVQVAVGQLTNGTDGGTGGAVTDPATLARAAEARRGRKDTEETKARRSASQKIAFARPEIKAKLRRAAKARFEAGNIPPVRRGEANNKSVLTDVQVRELRERHVAGEPIGALADGAGITRASATQLVTGQVRVDAGGPTRQATAQRKLTVEDREEIERFLVAKTVSQSELARRYGVDPSVISRIKNPRNRQPH